MDNQELAALRGIMDDFSFAPGQTAIYEKEEAKFFYVIVEGNAEVLLADATGQELFLEKLGPGDYFGELSMLTGQPRLARVRAIDALRTLALDRQEFHDFLMAHPHAGIDVLTVLSRRLYTTDQMLRQSVSRNVNDVILEKQTLGQRIADNFASVMGSWTFIIIQSVVLVAWIGYNIIVPEASRFDPYPFIFLNLALSFQAAYAAPIIMMSQNRQSDKDRLAAEIDHDVNMKAEVKTGLILGRLNDLERSLQFQHNELRKHMGMHEKNGSDAK